MILERLDLQKSKMWCGTELGVRFLLLYVKQDDDSISGVMVNHISTLLCDQYERKWRLDQASAHS